MRSLISIASEPSDMISPPNLNYLVGFREWAYREKAVKALALEPGDTVIEIGCGTGLNFALLESAVRSTGKIVGLDSTDSMLSLA